jgi:hypothetical protein
MSNIVMGRQLRATRICRSYLKAICNGGPEIHIMDRMRRKFPIDRGIRHLDICALGHDILVASALAGSESACDRHWRRICGRDLFASAIYKILPAMPATNCNFGRLEPIKASG